MSGEGILGDLERQLKPYRGKMETFDRIPREGRDRGEIMALLDALRRREEPRWKGGYASGAVYHGGGGHAELLAQAYALHAHSNPLHPDLWPSSTKFEAEIVAMTANMLSGAEVTRHRRGAKVVGAVSTGGTESILLAMLAYRDWGRARGIERPEVLAPVTAHAAFRKAAHYFGVRLVDVPVDEAFRADVGAMRDRVTDATVALVGSAPSFPHGAQDPIPEIAALAEESAVGCHVDACLGGFLLPWAERLGYPVTPFDFRLPGVTSISVDTHKYGYAAKGTSVILYRSEELFHRQCYAATDWPGGLYASPTLLGSRPGGLIAAAWASLLATGEEGYIAAARGVLEAADRIKQGVRAIPDLKVLGDPLFVIAIASDSLDVYRVMDHMAARGWSLNGLHHPSAFHIAVTRRHSEEGVADRFLQDLEASVREVRQSPPEAGGMAPLYGLASVAPGELVQGLLEAYLDVLYEV